MSGTTFVFENNEQQQKRLLAMGLVLLVVAAGAWISTRFMDGEFSLSFDVITPFTLFLTGSMSGLFFLPVPIELMYFTGVKAGSPPVLSMVAVVAGFVLGNIVSYLVGWKLSRTIMSIMPAKKVYTVRRAMHKWGVLAIFGMNCVPAPSPVLTFGLGLVRYPFLRLFVVLILANMTKFLFILYVL